MRLEMLQAFFLLCLAGPGRAGCTRACLLVRWCISLAPRPTPVKARSARSRPGRLAPRPRFRTRGAAPRILRAAEAVAGAAPAAVRKMMKFRFRRQGADPQREKLKQELFAFNKVRRQQRPGLGGRGRAGNWGRGPGSQSHVGLGGRGRRAGAWRRDHAPPRWPPLFASAPASVSGWVWVSRSLSCEPLQISLGLSGPVSASLCDSTGLCVSALF